MHKFYFNALSQEDKKRLVEQTLARCYQAWGVSKFSELLDDNGERLFDVSPSAVSQWATRGTMPWDFVMTTAVVNEVSLDKLFFGKSLDKERPASINFIDFEKSITDALYQCVLFELIDSKHVELIRKRVMNGLEGDATASPTMSTNGE